MRVTCVGMTPLPKMPFTSIENNLSRKNIKRFMLLIDNEKMKNTRLDPNKW